jgi:predicted transcriptional regulator
MASTAVRVDSATHSRLKKLSEDEKRPISQIVTELVAKYEDEKFWKTFHDDFARLRADEAAWQEYRREASEWLASDTLAAEDSYFAEGEFEAEVEKRAQSNKS